MGYNYWDIYWVPIQNHLPNQPQSPVFCVILHVYVSCFQQNNLPSWGGFLVQSHREKKTLSKLGDWGHRWQQQTKVDGEKKSRHYISGWWLNQPIWKICSSSWKSSRNRSENKKCLKPPPRLVGKVDHRMEFLITRQFKCVTQRKIPKRWRSPRNSKQGHGFIILQTGHQQNCQVQAFFCICSNVTWTLFWWPVKSRVK